MLLDECHFTYGSFNSRDYRLIFGHCTTEAYDELAGKLSSKSIFNRRNRTRYLLADDFENSPISFDAEIVTECAEPLSVAERKVIEKALFNKAQYQKMYIDAADDIDGSLTETVDGVTKRLYFNCRFVNPSRIANAADDVVGYKFTIECDSYLLWQDEITKTLSVSGSSVTVQTDTNLVGYTYPEVTIQVGSSGGDVVIANTTDDMTRLTKFHDLTAGIKLTMKGNLNYISGQNYEKFEGQNFIRLLDGSNVFSIQGDVTSVTFKWQNRRYLI